MTKFLKQEEVVKKWWLIDADGKILGRLASRVATILRGKNKVDFTPFVDCGDFVIVINAKKVKLTGKKLEDKIYYHHTSYIGGLKSINAKNLLEKKPEKLIYDAVWGMLPKNKLGRRMIKHLKVYSGSSHPHSAQMPGILSS